MGEMMNQNETIGKWAVKKGLLDCWHDHKGKKRDFVRWSCSKCGQSEKLFQAPTLRNPDYSIYESIAPVLDELKENGWRIGVFLTDTKVTAKVGIVPERKRVTLALDQSADLPTTLRDMVAELISKGEV